MSSLVFQGVQSFFNPPIFEPCGSKLESNQEHKENPCNQEKIDTINKTPSNYLNQKNNAVDTGPWNFIEHLSDKNKQANQDKNIYVHPLVKKSSSLSLKSLEMCTESLGSESGDEFSFPLSPNTNEEYRQMWKLKYEISSKTVLGNTNFPPPLTSINSSDTFQVTPHREGGRLVLKAAIGSHCDSYFQAERVDGRLRLCLEIDEIDGEYEEGVEEEEYDDEDENWVEDIYEMGIGDRVVQRRCKESGHENQGMPNWETYWVAIS